jgi:hypothetical protein
MRRGRGCLGPMNTQSECCSSFLPSSSGRRAFKDEAGMQGMRQTAEEVEDLHTTILALLPASSASGV